MRYNKVLLIIPVYKQSHYEYAGLAAGLGYVSEALFSRGVEQEIVDMRLGYNYGYLRKKLKTFGPDLVGVTLMSFRYKDHYALLERIKSDFKNVDIVAGGPHVSTFREKALEGCPSLDYGVTLEGDDTIAELCAGEKDLKDIKGLLYRDAGAVRYSGDRDFILDLDGKSFPRYLHFERNKYPRFISLVTSRGCPHGCIFCPVQLTIGRRLRVRSSESVLEEIGYWHKRGIRVFNVVDDNFTFFKQRVLEICDGITARGYDDAVYSCRNGVRADTVDREMLEAMKKANFNYLAFGVESASEKMLLLMKKGERLSAINDAVRDACGLGFMVTLFFIMGLPFETEKDLAESVDFALKYPVFDVRFYNPIPFPGTELFDWITRNKRLVREGYDYLNALSHWANDPVFDTDELPFLRRKELYKEINRKLRKHTLKTKLSFAGELRGLFSGLGIPFFLSGLLARLYYTDFFQKYMMETGFISGLRNLFRHGFTRIKERLPADRQGYTRINR